MPAPQLAVKCPRSSTSWSARPRALPRNPGYGKLRCPSCGIELTVRTGPSLDRVVARPLTLAAAHIVTEPGPLRARA